MVDRLMLAYSLLALLGIACVLAVWHLTKGRRRYARSRRAHHRARREARQATGAGNGSGSRTD